MKPKRPSIKDIAAKLNVSITTVSFVLNGKAREMRISEEVTKKILDYAKEINYTPNSLAQSLRTGKTNILVFMVEDISNPFFAKLARIIEEIAYHKGYKVIFCSNENDDRRTRELIQVFKDRKVDGYILIPSAGIEKQVKALAEDEIPLILFDRYFKGVKTNYVIIDNEHATHQATQHLIGNGYQNIGYVTIPTQQVQMQDRLSGYQKAIEEAGLKPYILELPYVEEEVGEGLMKKFFESHPELDAVFFATNYLAKRGLLVIKENFPDKVHQWGLLTFDDNEFFKIHTPSITAIAQPLEEIGKTLIQMMLQLLKKGSKKTIKQVVLPSKLIVRESSLAKTSMSQKS